MLFTYNYNSTPKSFPKAAFMKFGNLFLSLNQCVLIYSLLLLWGAGPPPSVNQDCYGHGRN